MASPFTDELALSSAPGLPSRFFDRFMFNLHPTDSTQPSVIVGAGTYPTQDVLDGFVLIVTKGEQRNLRLSTELSATNGSQCGPLHWQVVEPMRTWRVILDPNETGLAFDLHWTARTPAWFGEVAVGSGSDATAFEHLFQSGRYHGRLMLDGQERPVEGWYGQRDRSRGVRTLSGGQGLHLWYQAQFPDRCVGLLYLEDRAHRQLLLAGAVLHENGRRDEIVTLAHDLNFDSGLDLVSGRVAVGTASGANYQIDADASARGGYLAGVGYGGHHGRPLGRDHVEYEVYPLDGRVTPRALDSALTDRLARFEWGRTAGIGIVEFAVTRSPSYAYRPTLTSEPGIPAGQSGTYVLANIRPDAEK